MHACTVSAFSLHLVVQPRVANPLWLFDTNSPLHATHPQLDAPAKLPFLRRVSRRVTHRRTQLTRALLDSGLVNLSKPDVLPPWTVPDTPSCLVVHNYVSSILSGQTPCRPSPSYGWVAKKTVRDSLAATSGDLGCRKGRPENQTSRAAS